MKINGNLLKKARESKGYSLRDLSNKTGISTSTLNKWESPKSTQAFASKVQIVANELGISIKDISLESVVSETKKFVSNNSTSIFAGAATAAIISSVVASVISLKKAKNNESNSEITTNDIEMELKTKIFYLEKDLHEKIDELNDLKTQVEELEVDVKQKQEIIKLHRELLSSSNCEQIANDANKKHHKNYSEITDAEKAEIIAFFEDENDDSVEKFLKG